MGEAQLTEPVDGHLRHQPCSLMSGRVTKSIALAAGLIAGCAEYFLNDHWLGNGATNHYLYPPVWFVVTISTISAALASVATACLLAFAGWVWRRLTQRRG